MFEKTFLKQSLVSHGQRILALTCPNFEELGFKVGLSLIGYKTIHFQLCFRMVVMQGLKSPFAIGVGNTQFYPKNEGQTLCLSSSNLGTYQSQYSFTLTYKSPF